MPAFHPDSILGYGVVGLGFLLAFLAYRLLGREQQKEQPKRSILVAIHVFMIFSATLCVLGLGSEYFKEKLVVPDEAARDRLTARITELEEQLTRKVATAPEPKPTAEPSPERREKDPALAESMEAMI